MRNRRVFWLTLSTLVVGASLLAAAVILPPHLLDTNGMTTEGRLRAENDLRGTLVTVLGGIIVAVGAFVGILNFQETSRQNRAVADQNRAILELQRRGQITDRFSKAIDQLGASSMAVRTGGLYALEQIISDSPELQWAVMETLCAYLSQRTPHNRDGRERITYPDPATKEELEALVKPLGMETDVQAALTIIGRRNPSLDKKEGVLNLKNLDLGDARLRGAKLGSAVKSPTSDVANAGPCGSTIKLSRVNLRHTHLAGAHMEGACLARADFTDAVLVGAHLAEADLTGASFVGCDMRLADLSGAVIDGAVFPKANLEGVQWQWGAATTVPRTSPDVC